MAGDAIRASSAKISRLEPGRVGCEERDVMDQHSEVLPSWFEMYLRLEQAAKVIRCFELQFVPGLLQTEDYARTVILLGHRPERAEEVDQRVGGGWSPGRRRTGPRRPAST
ncbi:MAG: DUF5753 domain-containing protein [Pseudonocardia sp.]|nr:DUF5753 domain-containing protein [Pseudonocardia sp.]